MRAASYCSKCGQQIKAGRSSRLFFAPVCRECAGSYNHALAVASVILAAAIIFAAGRLTAPRQPLKFVGTPVDLSTVGNRPVNRNAVALAAGEAGAQGRATEAVCGAPTRSGRPCRRKVKDGGYCWQHRDKSGAKKGAAPAR
jgi:hypothetical protein